MSKKQVIVIRESTSGGNENFKDEQSGTVMNQDEFVSAIEAGNYPDYHVQNKAGTKIPRSNPDGDSDNNLG